MNSTKSTAKLTSGQLLILAVVLVAAIITTATFYLTLTKKEKESLSLDFKSTSMELTSVIEKEISLNLEALVSVNSLYAVADTITRSQFRTFNSNVLNRINSIHALSWIPKVKFEEKQLFESRARNDGLSQFLITEKIGDEMVPAQNREVYYPVYYIEPLRGNEKALGFDLASDSTRLSALQKAIVIDDLVATARITLVQEKSTQKAVLVFSPFRKEGKIMGLFTGVFRIEDLINRALSDLANKNCDLYFYDISAKEGNQLLAQLTEKDVPILPDDTVFSVPEGIHYHQTIKIADREWLILSTPTQSYLKSFPRAAFLIAILCIFLLIGIMYFLYRNFRDMNHRKMIERKIINSIIFSQEQDREYFAEDLNEGLAQMLAGLSFHIKAVESQFKDSNDLRLKESLSLIKQYIYHSLENTRKLAKELMPRSMMKFGLIASIEQHIDNLKIYSCFNIEFFADIKKLEIDKEIEITIYRAIVAILEKVKASPGSKNIAIEIKDDNAKLQIKIEVLAQLSSIYDINIKSSDSSLLPFQKRIELQGGQMVVNQDEKKEQTIITIEFESQDKNKESLKKILEKA